MSVRTFVSFEADFPTAEHPPGRELADFVAAALKAAGMTIDGPVEREGWAWDVLSSGAGLTIESIVGYSDDPPREWQVHTYAHLPLRKRWSRSAKAQRDALLRRWCEAIDSAIKDDPRFRSVRWYEQETFDKDYGETWHPAP